MRIEFAGRPIAIEFRPELRAWRGKLFCGGERGHAVHAGSFLRERRIVLDSALLRQPSERDRILSHEIFHFVWHRLGNLRRSGYEALVAAEFLQGAKGESGWSAEWRKVALTMEDLQSRTRRWREYCAESFCDTAASAMLSLHRHPEMTLATPARRRRWKWMKDNLSPDGLKI